MSSDVSTDPSYKITAEIFYDSPTNFVLVRRKINGLAMLHCKFGVVPMHNLLLTDLGFNHMKNALLLRAYTTKHATAVSFCSALWIGIISNVFILLENHLASPDE